MIEKKTVLVLGAGASMHLKFPSGEELIGKILSNLENLDPACGDRAKELVSLEYTMEELIPFRDALQHCGLQSIDAFLERRPEFIDLGKAAIAQALIPSENAEYPWDHSGQWGPREDNWYTHLYGKMGGSFEEFGSNELSVITYNYDRSLDFYLLRCLENTYGKDASECWEALSAIPIIHLHGQLGSLSPDADNYRPYGRTLDPEAIKICASSIKIISEDIDSYPQFKEAHKLLAMAEQIFFLGFGYHEDNLKRLRLDGIAETRRQLVLSGELPSDLELPITGGTRFGLTDREWNSITRRVTPSPSGQSHRTYKILAYLREAVDWD
ncbi:MAG: hypothetical protein QGH60_08710 [Phycisphaerae bacterium]|jgi:hypothetical protein|nr:hypothetical protein [Phycisphaerae bacterium]